MSLIKIEYADDTPRKCYTNVISHELSEAFFTFSICHDDSTTPIVKIIPANRIKHIQIEQ